jgi:hypothetical protein
LRELLTDLDRFPRHPAGDVPWNRSVQVGRRPIAVDTATVVDWAIWIDGQEIVEGGQTKR